MITSTVINCGHCNSSKETVANGFLVCTLCGTIKEKEYVDTKASLSKDGTFSNKQDSIGKSIDFVGSLGSQIGYKSGYLKNSKGKRLGPNIISKYLRLKNNYHDKARLNGNATHLRTMIAFNRVFHSLNISKDIKYRSLFLYWKIVNENDHKITNHILLIALCLLQAVREAKDRAPIRFSEVISSFNRNGHRVTNKNILRLARELNISLSPLRRKPDDYIERISSRISSSPKISSRLKGKGFTQNEYEMMLNHMAKKFLSVLDRKEIGGVQPYPFAVSVIYLSDRAISRTIKKKQTLTQSILADIADSAEFTIRDHVYRFLGKLYSKHEKQLIDACSNLLKAKENRFISK
ncbi:MAG: hypothetical protein INQ03_07040 [Candidatus Heimdallarchaeota archaeon]|nr:hypothetical protein [Candidatus Heimdallarchaeota archaeon]